MKEYKEVIRFFLFLLLLVILVPLLFSLWAIVIESRADNYANAQIQVAEPQSLSGTQLSAFRDSIGYLKRASRKYYLDSVQYKPLVKIAYYGMYTTYYYCHEHGLNLDFGQKAPVKLVVAISKEDALRSAANYCRDSTFNNAVILANNAAGRDGGDYLMHFKQAFEKDGSRYLAPLFVSDAEAKGKLSPTSTNDDVIKYLQRRYDETIQQTYRVIRNRLGQVSVHPKISLDPKTLFVTAEMDGMDDPARIHQLLTQVGKLEFWNTYETTEIIHYLDQTNTLLREATIDDTKNAAIRKVEKVDALPKDTDNFADIIGDKKAEEVQRKDKNPLFDLLYPNVIPDGQRQTLGEGPMIGRAFGKDTAAINHLLGMKEVKAIFPPDLKLLWGAHAAAKHTDVFGLYAVKRDRLSGEATITGDWITEAYKSFDAFGTPEVDFTMNSYGASAWERMTGQAAHDMVNGKWIHRCIAIAIDDAVFSAPRVMQKIAGGRSQISGIEDIEEADDLAIVIKSGKLLASTRITEEHIPASSSFLALLRKVLVFTGIIGILMGMASIIYYTVKDELRPADAVAKP